VTGEREPPGSATYFTDASVLRRHTGDPDRDLGPGEMALCHQTDEHWPRRPIEQSVEIYTRLAQAWLRRVKRAPDRLRASRGARLRLGPAAQCLARIAEREPVVPSLEVIDAEGSLAEARRIDALRNKPPLCGIPVGA